MREPWEVLRIDVEQIEEQGDLVTAAIRFRARGADSGVEVDMRFSNAIRVQDGLATVLLNRRTFEEAREALLQDERTPGRDAGGRRSAAERSGVARN
jgi:hypothetical protein